MRGTISPRPDRGDDVWRLRISGRHPITGKRIQHSKTIRGTEKQALRALKDFELELDAGVAAKDTFGAVLDDWIAFKARTWAPGTLVTVDGLVAGKIRPALGHRPVSAITARELDAFYGTLGDAGLGRSTIARTHQVISECLNQARRWGLIAANPARDASPPTPKRRPATERAADPADVAKVLDELPDDARFFVALATVTGARRGELCALRWTDLDGDTLTISRAVSQSRDGWVVKSTKTDNVRRLHLDAGTVDAWRAHRRQAVEAALAVGVTPSDWVFSMHHERHWKPAHISALWRNAAKRAGVAGVRLHDLRHLAATRLLALGVDPVTVANRLGHADATTTLRVYAHPDAQADKAAAEALARDLAGGAGR